MNNYNQNLIKDIKNAFFDIGYKSSWVRERYCFADLYDVYTRDQEISLGVFGQEPLDYRSACFGLEFAHQDESPETVLKRMRAFGAPQLFYIVNGETQRWLIHDDSVSLADTVPTENLDKLISDHRDTWNPQAILRAKAGFTSQGPQQLDFIDVGLLPALENEASRKIDSLVQRVCSHIEGFHQERNLTLNVPNMFSVVFQLLVGKLLKDREIVTTPRIDFSNVESVINAVRNHYPSEDQSNIRSEGLPLEVLQEIAKEVSSSFSFANLSAETLTYVYENTFVSSESRKDLGIHSTPSYLADYILSQMPIENIPYEKWDVWDPTCGHGIFLIAAMRRMRALLPQEWSGAERHKFFSRRLHGVDIEKFSVEVAKLCLMLADFPEANGWNLFNQNIFSGELIEEHAKQATIIVGNPPFEALEGSKPLARKPAELLRRMLPHMQDGSMMGMVLPRAFLDGSDYRHEREILLKQFELINITALPDRIFTHSEVESSIVIARKSEERKSFFLYREVYDSDRSAFRKCSKASWEEKITHDYFLRNRTNKFAIPRLQELWDTLANRPTLRAIAKVRTGIRYKTQNKLPSGAVTFYEEAGDSRRLGIKNVSSSFMQYFAEGQTYFSMRPDVQQNSAYQYDWDAEKVIVPASRTARGPWRYAAVLDRASLCVSRRFYAIWPEEENSYGSSISACVIAAILNSPLAMAYIYTHSSQKDIGVYAYESVPIPKIDVLQRAQDKISSLVEQYLELSKQPNTDDAFLEQALLSIDAEVLKIYDLSPRMERMLLDLFWGDSRRKLPFTFRGYFPPDFKPWMPLHKFISPDFAKSKAENIKAALPKKLSSETLAFFEELAENNND